LSFTIFYPLSLHDALPICLDLYLTHNWSKHSLNVFVIHMNTYNSMNHFLLKPHSLESDRQEHRRIPFYFPLRLHKLVTHLLPRQWVYTNAVWHPMSAEILFLVSTHY